MKYNKKHKLHQFITIQIILNVIMINKNNNINFYNNY